MAAPDKQPHYPWWLGIAARIGILIIDLLMPTYRLRLGAGNHIVKKQMPRLIISGFWNFS